VRLTPQTRVGTPDTLGIEYAAVDVPGDLGPLPAWLVPGTRDTWVIAVHGLGTTPEQALTLLPFLHRLDLPVLAPAYRGDPGAPRPEHGIGRLGHTEWHDLDAALRYAVRHGARRVVLLGWSTGATMALLTAAHSALAPRVSGLILDSPVLDWPATVRALAAAHHVPTRLLGLAVLAAEDRAGLDRSAPLPPGVRPVGPPTLIIHGPDDVIAPWQSSQTLATEQPDRVVLHPVPGARHAAMWNADPGSYEETLRRFLTPLA
jgi:alpha-beta hydrolase superfamily lysophospholipase